MRRGAQNSQTYYLTFLSLVQRTANYCNFLGVSTGNILRWCTGYGHRVFQWLTSYRQIKVDDVVLYQHRHRKIGEGAMCHGATGTPT